MEERKMRIAHSRFGHFRCPKRKSKTKIIIGVRRTVEPLRSKPSCSCLPTPLKGWGRFIIDIFSWIKVGEYMIKVRSKYALKKLGILQLIQIVIWLRPNSYFRRISLYTKIHPLLRTYRLYSYESHVSIFFYHQTRQIISLWVDVGAGSSTICIW